MSNETKLKTTINGIEYNLMVPARLLASDFLRDNLNLTGTHVGCEHGICGSCTIKIDQQDHVLNLQSNWMEKKLKQLKVLKRNLKPEIF